MKYLIAITISLCAIAIILFPKPRVVEVPTVIKLIHEVEVIREVEKIVYVEHDIDLMSWYWLAKIVYAEAEGDTDKGQQAVANVVLNRVASKEFPDTIYDVIWQKTGKIWQFSPCGDGRINLEPSAKAIENARLVLEGLRVVPDDVLFFYMPTKGNRGNWIRTRDVHEKIGAQLFCK